MGSCGKLCVCTTISDNAFWDSLLSVIDEWLELVGTHIFLFWEFPAFDKFSQSYLVVSFIPHEIYEFIVTRTSRDWKFPDKKNYRHETYFPGTNVVATLQLRIVKSLRMCYC